MKASMNCPQCGLQSLPDQKFCRSCGASLQLVTQPLAELATPSVLEMTRVNISNDYRPRGSRLVLWGFIVMFLGLAIGIIGKKLMHDDIVTVVGTLASLAGMFLMAYPYLSPTRSKKYVASPVSPEALTPSLPTRALPQGSDNEYAPSITERTTNLLKVSSAPRPGKNEDGESQA